MTLLILWVLLAVVATHVCSLLEVTLLATRTPMLLEQQAAGSRGAARLLAIKRARPDDAISAVLIVNTLASIVGAGLAGAQASRVLGEASVGGVSVALALLVLVVSEIVPKTLASAHAGRLAGFAGQALFYLTRLLAPVLVVTRALTRLLTRGGPAGVTRSELAALIAAAPSDGAISVAESQLLANLIDIHRVTLGEVHTPIDLVSMIDAGASAGDLIAAPGADAFSRIPLCEGERRNIVGYVSQRDVLRALATGGERTAPLRDFLRPIPRFPAALTVHAAVERLLDAREAIALVASDAEVIGIVTLEDLLEAMLGVEITDESDDVVVLRQAAEQARRRRTERLRRRQQERNARRGLVASAQRNDPARPSG